MSYTATDGYDDLMAVARELPGFDHEAEARLDDDDVSQAVDVAMAAHTLFTDQRREALAMLAEMADTMDNVLLHNAKHMPAADQASRAALVVKARVFLAGIDAIATCDVEVDDDEEG